MSVDRIQSMAAVYTKGSTMPRAQGQALTGMPETRTKASKKAVDF